MSTLITRHTPIELQNSLAAYLPGGELFESAFIPGSNFNALLAGLSGELLRAENFMFLYNSQFIPDETTVFIEEWESAIGIPDDCFLVSENDTNEQRRLNILVKLASLGVQTGADFENLAAILGFPDTQVLPGVGAFPNTINNGTFDTDEDWTKGVGWTIFAGTANHLIGTASDLSQDILSTADDLYAVSYDVLFRDTGTIKANVGGTNGIVRSENGSYEEVIKAGSANTLFSFEADSAFNGSVDNVVVRPSVGTGNDARFTIVVVFQPGVSNIFTLDFPIAFGEETINNFPLKFRIQFGLISFEVLKCLFTKLKPANCTINFDSGV